VESYEIEMEEIRGENDNLTSELSTYKASLKSLEKRLE